MYYLNSHFIVLACLLIIAPLVGHAEGGSPKNYVLISKKIIIPNIAMLEKDGERVFPHKFYNKTVVLNFWATWCAPCIKELPSLNRLAKNFPSDKFVVIALSEDAGGFEAAKSFLSKLNLSATTILSDPGGKLKRALSVRGLPTTFIILPGGIVHGRVEGAIEWDSPEIMSFLSNLQ
jgi:thiol-disulfide isomerase/thioredoxin